MSISFGQGSRFLSGEQANIWDQIFKGTNNRVRLVKSLPPGFDQDTPLGDIVTADFDGYNDFGPMTDTIIGQDADGNTEVVSGQPNFQGSDPQNNPGAVIGLLLIESVSNLWFFYVPFETPILVTNPLQSISMLLGIQPLTNLPFVDVQG